MAIYHENEAKAKAISLSKVQAVKYDEILQEQARPKVTIELPHSNRPESTRSRIISYCPICQCPFTFMEEVMAHRCSNKPEDLRAEYEDLRKLKETMERSIIERTI